MRSAWASMQIRIQLGHHGSIEADGMGDGVMITIDFGTHLVAIRWRSKGTQLFRQQCCRVIYTSKGPCQ